MDSIEFSKQIPSEQLAIIFKDFFEQHMLIYDILRDIQFVTISEVSFDKSSIIYSVKLLSIDNISSTISSAIKVVLFTFCFSSVCSCPLVSSNFSITK